jgi:uncharacterized metal-binding protein
MNYMAKKMDRILVSDGCSLKNLIQKIRKDAAGPVDEHSFINDM